MKLLAGVVTFLWAGACWAQGRGGGEPGKQPEQPKCDLKKLEKGKYCETCGKLCEKEDLQEDAWTCKACAQRVKVCDVCVKEYWECPECKGTAFKEGTCATEGCKSKRIKLEKKLSKARMIWRCRGTCMQIADAKKSCGNPECSHKGKDYEYTCSESGRPPHVKAKK